MAILSNKARVIQSLSNYGSPSSGDLLVIQDVLNNKTKNITLGQLSSRVASFIQSIPVDFSNSGNQFTGSFKGGKFNGSSFTGQTAVFADSIDVLDGDFVADNTKFQAINFQSMVFGTTGDAIIFQNEVFYQKNITATAKVVSTGGFTGSLSGSIKGRFNGDVYSETWNKVLENSSNLAKNAAFYGSSSFAHRTTSSSYAKTASLTLACVTHATSADNATSALSSSYASSSRSSSYLKYTGANNGSASYAMRANVAEGLLNPVVQAKSASFLRYTGQFNGSASYARSSSYVPNAKSASFLRYNGQFNGSASYARTASYVSGVAKVSVLDNGGSGYNIPVYSAYGNSVQIAHGLGRKPYVCRVVAICRSVTPAPIDVVGIEYAVGDEIEITNFLGDRAGEGLYQDAHIPITITTDATYVVVGVPWPDTGIYLMGKSKNGSYALYSRDSVDSNYINPYWGLKVYVM